MKGTSKRNERRGATGMPPAGSRARAGGSGVRVRPVVPARVQPVPGVAASSVDAPGVRLGAGIDLRGAVAAAVEPMHYELVDVERSGGGLLRVTIDRLPGHAYAEPGAWVTVGDCEAVTRQLQYALEVDGVDYARLEVSSPGLDRPLRNAADFQRFAGERVRLALKEPFGGRRHFEGLLGRAEDGGCTLQFQDGKGEQLLGFAPDEVREARLVPVVDFKGRRTPRSGAQDETAVPGGRANAAPDAAQDEEEVIR